MYKILCLAMLVVCFNGCSGTQDEREYKNVAIELNSMLIKLKTYPVQQSTIKLDKGIAKRYDYSQRMKFIEDTKHDWVAITEKLQEFSQQHPNSIWADDSLFCLVLYMNLNPADKSNMYNVIATDAIKKLAHNYTSVKLEKWTIVTFEETVFKEYRSSLKPLFPKDTPVDDQYNDYFKLIIAKELIEINDVEKARIILSGLKQKYPLTGFEQLIDEILEKIK